MNINKNLAYELCKKYKLKNIIIYAEGKNGEYRISAYGVNKQEEQRACKKAGLFKSIDGWPNHSNLNESVIKRICKNCQNCKQIWGGEGNKLNRKFKILKYLCTKHNEKIQNRYQNGCEKDFIPRNGIT